MSARISTVSQPLTSVDSAHSQRLLDDYVTTEQLAAELDVAPLTLLRWRAQKLGPPITRIGRKVFYRRSRARQWLLEQEARDNTHT
jgi:hypothetical protein